ncbi:hypothetical protein BD560DRAFT_367835 [Blakeslea trispora]|nr:hypothetical protein BD560DRAFT_367835 [Blakeslea trispora]
MRPDQHKSKESRKYQTRKKQSGDSSAAEVAEARRKAAKARDRGEGVAAIQRRNGDWIESEEDREERKLRQAKFSKRKIESNVDRYREETEQEALERDIELGIDRETTDLVDLLENTEEGTSTFFKFKEEQLSDQDAAAASQLNKNMLALDFSLLDSTLASYDTIHLLGLEADRALVEDAMHQPPVVLDKPIVPAFSKNAKGYVLFKSQQQAKPNVISEADGIYLRNDGSNHRPATSPSVKQLLAAKEPEKDDLDELLALDQKKKESVPINKAPTEPATALPKPGSIKKPSVIQPKPKESGDDEAWLDDLLG